MLHLSWSLRVIRSCKKWPTVIICHAEKEKTKENPVSQILPKTQDKIQFHKSKLRKHVTAWICESRYVFFGIYCDIWDTFCWKHHDLTLKNMNGWQKESPTLFWRDMLFPGPLSKMRGEVLTPQSWDNASWHHNVPTSILAACRSSASDAVNLLKWGLATVENVC